MGKLTRRVDRAGELISMLGIAEAMLESAGGLARGLLITASIPPACRESEQAARAGPANASPLRPRARLSPCDLAIPPSMRHPWSRDHQTTLFAPGEA